MTQRDKRKAKQVATAEDRPAKLGAKRASKHIQRRRRPWNKSTADRVATELERRKNLDIRFAAKDLQRRLRLSYTDLSRYAQPYIENLSKTLLTMKVESEDDFRLWQNTYDIFRHYLTKSKRATELVNRKIRMYLDFAYEEDGEVPTLGRIAAAVGSTGDTVSATVKAWCKDHGITYFRRMRPKGPAWHKRQLAVREEMQKRRTLGKTIYSQDIATSLGIPVYAIAEYGAIYSREVAEEMLHRAIETDDQVDLWERDFRVFLRFFRVGGLRKELRSRRIRIHIEQIHRKGLTPTATELGEKISTDQSDIRRELKAWAKDNGVELRPPRAWKEVTLNMVLRVVDPRLHRLPLTFLEDQALGKSFNESQLRMIWNIKPPNLRNTAFMVLAFADRNRRNDLAFFTELAEAMMVLGIQDIDSLDPDTFYVRYHNGEYLKEHSATKRGYFIRTYFRILGLQDEYLRRLTDGQRELVAPFALKNVRDNFFWRKSKLLKGVKISRTIRRKQDVSIVHAKFYQLRHVVDRRRVQVENLLQAYERAIEHAKAGQELPLNFSFSEEIVRPDSSTIRVSNKFTLWDSKSLKAAHIRAGGSDYYKTLSVKERDKDHPSNWSETFQLSYEGSHTENDPSVSHDYWFMEIFAEGSTPTEHPALLSLRKNPAGFLPQYFVRPALRSWLSVLTRELKLSFIPVDTVVCSALLAHAGTQVQTKTGARINEFLQIQLTADNLSRVRLPNESEVIVFYAIPKGRTKPEPYYIDEQCMQALFAWYKYHQARGNKFGPVPFARSLRDKIGAGPYLWQIEERHVEHRRLNASLLFMLFDVSLVRPDGSAIKLTSHLLRHGFATEMRALDTPIDVLALLMNQRDTSVTEYYSQPTPAMLVQFQKRIFEGRIDLSRTHIRAPAQIQRQIEEAMGKIGAMAPVTGGTCTVAHACPSGFACIGCFGNAPDPKKRHQVLVVRKHWTQTAEIAKKEGLHHEHRKALGIVANCEDVLIEMDRLEAADRASNAGLSIRISEQERG